MTINVLQTVFWVVMPCWLFNTYWHSERCGALKSSAITYQPTHHKNNKDLNLWKHPFENLRILWQCSIAGCFSNLCTNFLDSRYESAVLSWDVYCSNVAKSKRCLLLCRYARISPNLASSITIHIGLSEHTPMSLMMCGWSNCCMISGNTVWMAPSLYSSLTFENTKQQKVKGKMVPAHAMKAYMGSRVTAPLILNLSIMWQ
jgi:hypothetical protein